MNLTRMEELLNDAESSSLDFKRDQYPFESVTDELKSELLKDILAFANAWRSFDAYILIGVEDVQGGRGIVHGISTHFDDAKIQQFVNSKTNRPITFSYFAFLFEEVQIGVIQIPLQDRPIYLKKDFGKLIQKTVYIRRGSSTAIAEPDEVAKMGEIKVQASSSDRSVVTTHDPILTALKNDYENQTEIIIEVINHPFDKQRFRGKIKEINDIYATFHSEGDNRYATSPLTNIRISAEPSINMRIYSLLPLA